ncbi:MAG TPA: sulfocyanin-like copper-binding protein [bacterium]|nr:sulfocyanin-like copper-binding protein [bacterium]
MRRKAATDLFGGARTGVAIGLVVAAMALLAGAPALAAAHTVHVTIVADQTPADNGYNLDGYARGGMTVTVPVGWKVVVTFKNDGALAHSLIVLPYTSTPPAAPASETPAFPGAATKHLAKGLPRGTTTTFSFVASRPGTYEFVCGVPGHATLGMWDKLVVSATAKKPSITPAPAAKIVHLVAQ